MAGPCSLPLGDKFLWEQLNTLVCSQHRNRDGANMAPCSVDKCKAPVVTFRMWLATRGRLQTGKTHGSPRA